MLCIQKFIYNNPNNWKELLTKEPYCLKIKEQDNLVIFNYNTYKSDFSKEIVKEARGLILELGTFRVVRMAFYKFFNLGEPNAANIDWDSATATSKEDGSIMSAYWYGGTWHIASNSCIDVADAVLDNIEAPYRNYKELFFAAACNCRLDFAKLNPKNTYTFELVSPYNKIVVPYSETKLFHINTRDNNTLEELNEDIGIEKPKFYSIHDRKGFEEIVSNLGENHEGIVIKDKYNNRVKLKTEEYIRLHYMEGETKLTLLHAIYIIINHEQAEYLQYFPERKAVLKALERRLNEVDIIICNIEKDVKSKTWNDAREVFEYYKKADPKFVDLYVAAYKGTLDKTIHTLKNRNETAINRYKENYERIKQVINEHNWTNIEDMTDWAVKHDSKNSPVYVPIYQGQFNKYIKKLQKTGITKYLEKFDVTLDKDLIREF